jgi:hypothetical protein
MQTNNTIDKRKEELIKTGLCEITDFRPETKTHFDFYTFNFRMDQEAKNLLKKAHEVLGLENVHLERIERITQAIIKVHGETSAEACHIAEAIQYVAPETVYSK